MFNKSLLGAVLMTVSSTVSAVPVDLSSWSANDGSWNLSPGNNSVTQDVNIFSPAVFFNGTDSQGLSLSGEITVQTVGGDDDFIGFVLGYHNGDITSASADYLLIDWKQATQAASGHIAEAGLSISQVTGAPATDYDFWEHSGSVNELQRATTLGSTGWNDSQTYSFSLIFTATNVQVIVDGMTELNISGSFSDGSFGFYDYSQESVLYANIEEESIIVPSVPAPNILLLLMAGVSAMKFSQFRRNKA